MDLVTYLLWDGCLNVLVVVKCRHVDYISVGGCMIDKCLGSGCDKMFLLFSYVSCGGAMQINAVVLDVDHTDNILRNVLVIKYNVIKTGIMLGGTTTISSGIAYLRHGTRMRGCNPGRNSKMLIMT